MPMPNLPIKTGHAYFGLALLLCLATFGLFSGGNKSETKKTDAKIDTLSVVVPLTQINQGETLSSEDVTLVKWPKAFLPNGAIFSHTDDVSGRVAKQTLFPGEPIFIQKLSGANTANSLTALIPKGKRAITISVSEVKGVAGFVKPGDFVDVLSTFEITRQQEDNLKKTKTVLQHVLVLASAQTMVSEEDYHLYTPPGVTKGDAETPDTTDKAAGKTKSQEALEKQITEREKEKKSEEKDAKLVSSVTLALTPHEAEILALAEESGDLRLVLRPESDNGQGDLDGIDTDTLHGKPTFVFQPEPMPIGKSSVPPPPAFTPPPPMLGTQVEFIQGDNKTLYNFNHVSGL